MTEPMTRMTTQAAIRFDDVTLGYDRHPAVHHLDGVIARGSLTAIVGPNGAGKSTLLKGIVGALRPLGGRIEMPRREAAQQGEATQQARIAYLPQAAELDRSFPIPVYDLVAMGLWGRRGLFGRIRRADHARIAEAIAAVGMTGFERRTIGTLSGGQMQRVLFARLLLQDASLILLDEPFTAIDAKTTRDLLDLVRRWHDEARTVIAVLHDIDLVREVFPETLLIAREPVAWGATDNVLRPENLLHARRMVEANDPFAQACERA
ncbi:zinc ABC transporter ATP-binding protein AztA [Saliniramus sp.]|uniref:zinc ABC transporter ATP-binding protein AztA n=1 Tax=Saliniramus sp. TaxID=2986772 RepID=UPI002CE76F82|nr:zinc ABC transporter ATP-binding protein AztA [Saliniramus sp.]HMB11673.1 zinc ABC transporter ATP-binding protein AztA [Saliniramus sp.]